MGNYNYMLYVRKYDIFTNGYKLFVYQVQTDDIFHTIGEYIYRSMESIERINFNTWTENRVEYWIKNGFEIREWKDRYKNGEEFL